MYNLCPTFEVKKGLSLHALGDIVRSEPVGITFGTGKGNENYEKE